MPRRHYAPSVVVRADIRSLQGFMGAIMPSKRLVEHLRIATWGIRGFASLKRCGFNRPSQKVGYYK